MTAIPSILANGLLTPDGVLPIYSGYYTADGITSNTVSFPPGHNRILILCEAAEVTFTFEPFITQFPFLQALSYVTSTGVFPLMRPLTVHPRPEVMLFWFVIPDDDTGGTLTFERTGAWQLWQDCDTEQPFQSLNVNHGAAGTRVFNALLSTWVITEPKYTAIFSARQDPSGLPVALFVVGGDNQEGVLTGPTNDVSQLGIYPDNPTIGSDIGGAVDLIDSGGGIVDLGDVASLGRARVSRASSPLLPDVRVITVYCTSGWTVTKDTGYRAAWALSPGTCGTPLSLVAGGYDLSTPDRGDIGPSTSIGLTLRPDQAHATSPWITQGWFHAGEIGAGYVGLQSYPGGAVLQSFSDIEIYNSTWTILPGGGLDTKPFTYPTRMNEDTASFAEIVGGFNFAIARDTTGGVWASGLDTDSIDGTEQTRFFGSFFAPATRLGTLGQGRDWPACASEVWLPVTGISGATGLEAGFSHACALRGIQPPLLWGSNSYGQLGAGLATTPVWDGTAQSYAGSGYSTPVEPIGLGGAHIVQAACGSGHTLLLDSSGAVYSSGANGSGQLGLGDFSDRNGFVLVPGLPPIVEITCGLSSSFARTADGHVFATGFHGGGPGWGIDISVVDPGFTGVVNTWVEIYGPGARQIRCYTNQPFLIRFDNTIWCTSFDSTTSTSSWIPYTSGTYSFLNRGGFQYPNGPRVAATTDGRLLDISTTIPREFTPPLKGTYAAVDGQDVTFMLTGPVIVPRKGKPFVTCQSVGPY